MKSEWSLDDVFSDSPSTVDQPRHRARHEPDRQVFGTLDQPISWKMVVDSARMRVPLAVEPSAAQWGMITRSHAQLVERISDGVQVYGVTTGFGESARRTVSPDVQRALQSNLLDYLDCALGELASPELARATLLIRIVSLAQGYSAVSPELVRRLIAVYSAGYAPAIPLQGSLGASGDLIPLASIGQCIRGVGEAYTAQGELISAQQMLERLGLGPFEFAGKDALGLVNGTSLMTATACLAIEAFEAVWDWYSHSAAGLFTALRVHSSAFSSLVNTRAKSHPGQSHVAAVIRELCGWQSFDFAPQRENGEHQASLQDPYSMRCTPQVLGPCWEVLQSAKAMVEREINSCNDNPLVDPESGEIASGGNFYGGYIALAMDQLAWAGAHIADLMDRQILVAVHENLNRGLPSNLSGASRVAELGQEALAHHGLKGLHQHASALTSEIVRMAMPCSTFSRSAESHNQDKISLGTHSARNALAQLKLLKQLGAIHSACAAQALDLRGEGIPEKLEPWHRSVRAHVPFVHKDQRLRAALQSLCDSMR